MKAITLYDVALLAGVSYQTVSRVINDAEHVSARTREKVQQAMAELHYVPNLRAQQLAGKRTRTLGLITTDLALHAPSQIVSAVKSRAAEQGKKKKKNESLHRVFKLRSLLYKHWSFYYSQ